METGNLEFILAWASILGAVLAVFAYLHREMRRGFNRVDQRFAAVDDKFLRSDEKFEWMEEKFDQKFERMEKNFDEKLNRMEEKFDQKFERMGENFDQKFGRMDEKFEGMRADVTAVRVSVARIEGHLGIGMPAAGKSHSTDRGTGIASPDPATPAGKEVA